MERKTLDASCLPGWVECRWLRCADNTRVARWWHGGCLFHGCNDRSPCDVREYTDFVRLVPAGGECPECAKLTAENERLKEEVSIYAPLAEKYSELEEWPKLVVGDGKTLLSAGHLYAYQFVDMTTGLVARGDGVLMDGVSYLDYGIPSFPAPEPAKLKEPRVFQARHDGKAEHWFIEWPDGKIHSQFSCGFKLGFGFESRAEFEAAGWKEAP